MMSAHKRRRPDSFDIDPETCSLARPTKKQRTDNTVDHQPIIDDYTVGLICALQCEYDALCRMLCEEFDDEIEVDSGDSNAYVLGRIQSHYVVIGCLPTGRQGNCSAAGVAKDMLRSFPNLKFALLVGIGGGVPSPRNDIRLGDVVVSVPNGKSSGVIKYDFGKRLTSGKFEMTSQLNAPPEILLAVITEIRRRHKDTRKPDTTAAHMERMNDMPDYQRPMRDTLYRADYSHCGPGRNCSESCGSDGIMARSQRRSERKIEIHFGTIASGDSVIKDSVTRDSFASDANHDILCFEMEAAGLMNNLPCLVIRGISDYADSHKNDDWQNYAALSATAFARELLFRLKPSRVAVMPRWVHKLEKRVEKIHSDVNECNLQIEKDKIYRWLNPADAYQNYNRALEMREDGTAQWILKDPRYEKWTSKRGSLLWLSGISGSGKTVLASSVIEHIAQFTAGCNQLSNKTALLFFYFDFSDANKQSHRSMVCSFIWQMIEQAAEIKDESAVLKHELHACQDGYREASPEQLYEILFDLVEKFTDVFVVIDATDESTEKDRVLHFINALLDNCKNKIHFLVTSRTENDLSDSRLRHLSYESNKIILQKKTVSHDITQYVRQRLKIDKDFQKWSKLPHIYDTIEIEILKKSEGMFRLAVCQLDDLKKTLNVKMLEMTLKSLPRTLEEEYSRVIGAIDEEHKIYALRVLQWLVHSKRPLTIAEMIDVLAVDLASNPCFSKKNRFPNQQDILRICSSLVVVENADNIDSSVVKLSHASVRDYLMSNKFEISFGGMMQKHDANSKMASTCLGYLLALNDEECAFVGRLYHDFPFMSYATTYWMLHARLSHRDDEILMQLMKDFFLNRENLFNTWIQQYEAARLPPCSSGTRSNNLYYASYTGSEKCVEYLLQQGADPNVVSAIGRTALACAVHEGFENVVQTLLRHGSMPDFVPDRPHSRTPLQIAVRKGYFSIAKELLDFGANPNFHKHRKYDLPPLISAVLANKTGLAKLLLEHGANPNIEDGEPYSGSALRLMSKRGNVQLVRLLLSKGADPKLTCGGKHASALEEALYNRHKSVAELLFKHGAINEVDIEKDNNMRVAMGGYLEMSSYNGEYSLVKLLLDHVFKSTSKHRDVHGVALWMACSQGHSEVVKLLVETCRSVTGDFIFLAQQSTPASCQGRIFPLLQELAVNMCDEDSATFGLLDVAR